MGFSRECGEENESLAGAVAQRLLDRGTGLQSTEHVDGSDGLTRKFGRDVWSDDRETKDLDVKHLTGRLHGLQIPSAVLTQAEVELLPCDGLLDGVVVSIELVPDGCPNEVRSIGVKALLYQEIDVAEIHIAEIDSDFLAVRGPRPKFLHFAH